MSVSIEVGQVWRDKDTRRSRLEGSVRRFRVIEVTEFIVYCLDLSTSKKHGFNRRRFGNGQANDSFELVTP